MTSYEIDIPRTADLWRRRHGDTAVVEAEKMAAQYRAAGDRHGAEIWRRVVWAIEGETRRQPAAIH